MKQIEHFQHAEKMLRNPKLFQMGYKIKKVFFFFIIPKYEFFVLSAFRTLEMPLAKVLSQMELHGVGFDRKWTHILRPQVEERLHFIHKFVKQFNNNESLNISSTRDTHKFLFETLNLKHPYEGNLASCWNFPEMNG